jgi:hypothetical protein
MVSDRIISELPDALTYFHLVIDVEPVVKLIELVFSQIRPVHGKINHDAVLCGLAESRHGAERSPTLASWASGCLRVLGREIVMGLSRRRIQLGGSTAFGN